MKRRVTIRDLAQALDLHYSTVSLALRDHPRIPPATRKRVREMAKKMDYSPDAMVQALAAYRGALRPSLEQGVLAWLMKNPMPAAKDSYPYDRFFKGAQERARDLGYNLEKFSLAAPGMTPKRMETILRTRGIRGIIVAPQPPPRAMGRIMMDWSEFSAVAIGYSLAWPPIPAVSNHQFLTVQIACRKLRSLGYERIGLCVDRTGDERVHGAFVGGYLSDRVHRSNTPLIKPFIFDTWNTKLFRSWYARYNPQAVIFHDSDIADLAIKELKVKVPKELGVVCLTATSKGYAAVNQNQEQVGAGAVDLVVSLIYRQQRGIPALPQRLLIEGTWINGYSVRRMNAVPAP